MCTVTFVRSKDKIILTSNRDDHVLRSALEPKTYSVNQKNILFPKDPKAGGTWYAVDESANVLILLNGAAEKHHHNPPYRKSRGIIVLDVIGSHSPIEGWHAIDLNDIEPFTIVLFQQPDLYQLRWNGVEKETISLDPKQNYIWSSTTLYPKEIRDDRAQWFIKFLKTKTEIDETDLYHFHKYTETDDHQNGLVIDRNGQLKTLSITQTIIEANEAVMKHYDLIGQKEYTNLFQITPSL